MMFWRIFIIFILLIILWILIDMKLGRRRQVRSIPPYEELPIRTGNSLFFSSGYDLFHHLIDRVRKAEDHVHMQFYIFREDSIGTKLLTELMKKAEEGVSVHLIVDWFGSKISKNMQNKLKNAGVMFVKSRRPRFPFLFFSMQVRSHRKTTIIDGKYGYIGGFNIGDEYLGRDPVMGNWRDYHLFLTGQVVQDLQVQFIKDWNLAHARKISLSGSRYFPDFHKGDLQIQIHPTKGAHVKEKLLKILAEAKESILIGSPYFIPGKEMTNHLLRFSKKGVRVLLLIPKKPDHPMVRDAAIPYLRILLEHGITVRQFTDGFFHSKIIVVDNTMIDVGTANFDHRSFHLNDEMNCIIRDERWVSDVKRIVDEDFYEKSEELTLASLNNRTLFQRMKEWLASRIESFL